MSAALIVLAIAAATPARLLPFTARADEQPSAMVGRNDPDLEQVRLLVSPLGIVFDCEVIVPSASRDNNRSACKILRNQRAKPAIDRNEKRVYGSIRLWSSWSFNAKYEPPKIVDLTVFVDHLPEKAIPRPIAKLALVVEAGGAVEACDVNESSGFPALDAAACTSGVARAEIAALRDASGTPVRSVQPLNVAFAIDTGDAGSPRR